MTFPDQWRLSNVHNVSTLPSHDLNRSNMCCKSSVHLFPMFKSMPRVACILQYILDLLQLALIFCMAIHLQVIPMARINDNKARTTLLIIHHCLIFAWMHVDLLMLYRIFPQFICYLPPHHHLGACNYFVTHNFTQYFVEVYHHRISFKNSECHGDNDQNIREWLFVIFSMMSVERYHDG